MATPDRWAPWIEPRVSATGDLVVNSTATGDVPGVTVTFTPHVDTRLRVDVDIDLLCDVISGGAGAADGLLIVELVVNGVAQGTQLIARPRTATERLSLSKTLTVNLTKETTYTIKVTGRLNNTTGGAPTYTIKTVHTGMCIQATPNLHA